MRELLAVYNGLHGHIVEIAREKGGRICIIDIPLFTAEQYTGFITREYERLVNEGVIEKPLHFEGKK